MRWLHRIFFTLIAGAIVSSVTLFSSLPFSDERCEWELLGVPCSVRGAWPLKVVPSHHRSEPLCGVTRTTPTKVWEGGGTDDDNITGDGGAELAIVRCGRPNLFGYLTGAAARVEPVVGLSRAARGRAANLGNPARRSAVFQSQQGRPNVQIILVDSMSVWDLEESEGLRATREALRWIEASGKARVLRFGRFTPIASDSTPHTAALLGGADPAELYIPESRCRDERPTYLLEACSPSARHERLVFRDAEAAGYATAWAHMMCQDMGFAERPADHALQREACHFSGAYGYHPFFKGPRVVEGTHAHDMMLAREERLLALYAAAGIPLLSILFFMELHEPTRTAIRGLDASLGPFLERQVASRDNVVTFLLADHGSRFRNMTLPLNQFLPSLVMIVPERVFGQLTPAARASLETNAKDKMVTMFDLHATLLDLFGSDRPLRPFQRSTLAPIEEERQCPDANVPWSQCWDRVTTWDDVTVDKDILAMIVAAIEARAPEAGCERLKDPKVWFARASPPNKYRTSSLLRVEVIAQYSTIFEAMLSRAQGAGSWVVDHSARLTEYGECVICESLDPEFCLCEGCDPYAADIVSVMTRTQRRLELERKKLAKIKNV